jgi:penicillin-binding protein 1A
MTVVDATINSVNVVYAQLIMKVGAENVEKLCNDMGIEDIGSNPAIALGGLEEGITPLDVSKFFSTLAANGYYREPVCILKITDSSGNILYEYDPDKNENNKQIMDAPAAYYTTKILERVILEGTGKGANIGRPAAGKTGTTSDFRDAWFGGYSPELATVVWMGHVESNRPMEPINGRNLTGGSYPADIWREFMIAALKDRPIIQFEAPEGAIIENETAEDLTKKDNINENKKEEKGQKEEKKKKKN